MATTTPTPATRQIVIVGGSFAGLSIAHYLLRKTLPQRATANAPYTVLVIDQSTHFWSKPSAPRAMVTQDTVPDDRTFLPIADALAVYGAAATFKHGTVTALDLDQRVLHVRGPGEEAASPVPYYALILAPGISTPTRLTSIVGSHDDTLAALRDFRALVASKPKSIIIGGGGPIAVETAGELAEHVDASTKITLITGAPKLLPALSASHAAKAAKILSSQGVEIVYDTRITSASTADGSTTVVLANGSTLTAEAYLPATGATPNTSFLPAALLNEQGYITTSPTLRVPHQPRTYALGDAATYSPGSIPLLFDAVPILANNIARELEITKGGVDKEFAHVAAVNTHVVPLGRKRGVGTFKGWGLPAFVVSAVKGKDYFVAENRKVWDGSKWGKAPVVAAR